jgi:hypothetical protein
MKIQAEPAKRSFVASHTTRSTTVFFLEGVFT